ncbi:Guanine aminohydrolase, partial [Pseudomonas savastanoi pv. glycinea]
MPNGPGGSQRQAAYRDRGVHRRRNNRHLQRKLWPAQCQCRTNRQTAARITPQSVAMSHNESAMSSVSRRKAYRAAILHSIADPAEVAVEASYEYFADGLLLVENGKIISVGNADDLLDSLDGDVELIE